MPRKPQVIRKQQVFELDDDATVTIDFVAGKRPKFFQPQDGVVIIGEHQCGAAPVVASPPPSPKPLPSRQADEPFASNFEVNENDPEYLAFKAKFPRPAPPDFSPPVVTNDQLSAEFEQRVKQEHGLDVSVPNSAAMVKMAG